MTNTIYQPDLLIHPGESLRETLEALGMSQKEFSDRAGITPKTVNEIVKGKNPITPESAIKFEIVTGVPASFWNNLEKNYRQNLAQKELEVRLLDEAELARQYICYTEAVKFGLFPKTNDMKERARYLMKFFGVTSLSQVDLVMPVAFRISSVSKVSKECIAIWLRWGEIQAQSIDTKPFNRSGLISKLALLRSLSVGDIEKSSQKVVEICADNGVSVVYTPHLKNTPVQGATRWLAPEKALIQLSLRYGCGDIFWFTLFHEIGHILKHGKKEAFLDLEGESGRSVAEQEKEADRFATETLIPSSLFQQFVQKEDFSNSSIRRFAKSISIDPAIVAGRLAKSGLVSWSQVSNLRPRLRFLNS